MTKPQIKGILGFPVTPFTDNNRLDEQALVENINFLIDGGLDAIYVCAGASEFQSLSRTEYETIVEIAVSSCKGKLPVYTGVGGNIKDAIDLARISQEKGADGYLMLPPYLINGEQEGLFNYYKGIIETSELNAIIYQRDNAILTLPTIMKLSELPQVVGIKDGIGNMDLNIECVQTIGQNLNWINGMPLAEATFQAYRPIGFNSYSSAISNYIPHVSRLFFDALQEDDQVLINKLYKEVIFPINNLRKQKKGYAVSLIKAGMEIMGQSVGKTVRPPLVSVEKDHYIQLEKIIKNILDEFPLESSHHFKKVKETHL